MSTWDLTPGSLYLEAVKAVDAVLGMILELVDEDPELAGRAAIILTADHSGELWTTFHVLLPPIFVGSGIVLALDLLGLPPVPGSAIDRPQDLSVQ